MPYRRRVRSLLSLLLQVIVAASATASSLYSRSSNCTRLLPDAEIVRNAFLHVGNFPLPRRSACHPVRRLRFPSSNLTGVLRWEELANLSSLLTLDLSGNSLQRDIHAAFWRAPSLRAVDVSGNRLGGALRFEPSARLTSLNVAGNRFISVDGVDMLAALENLDLSGNIIAAVPEGLLRLTRIRRLDLSGNMMAGLFPDDFPPLDGIDFLNISHNRFSGKVDAHTVRKFGLSAFSQAGNASLFIEETEPAPALTPPTSGRKKHRRGVLIVVVVCTVVAVAALVIFAGCVACGFRRRKKDKDGKTVSWAEEEVVVGAVKVAATAPVVVLERPLMDLTLADLAAATSGFGRESQLADVGGRSGAAYRAVLPGDLDVVVRVVEGDVSGVEEDDDAAATAAGFRELARLRHPNILPLLGYCIAGKEKLLLYEYMEKGDLHRWLHELPTGSMVDAQETSIDTSDVKEDSQSVCDWPARHRMILGIARGLAFLHQGWAGSGRPIVHGHLVPTNILLGDDLEPRISDFMHHVGGGNETPESDVYSFGVLVFELVTGQSKWDEATVAWARGVIRNKKGESIVDAMLREVDTGAAGQEVKREAAECLQVGFLCTAPSPQKRPTMQQVVGVLKDIRPAPAD